ncbi:MAG TPA: DUF3551 domain-containing protein [Longimicrobiales bacterium]|nr:DUF3551 domain-containing protein [Longimicrobiales bacterium]
MRVMLVIAAAAAATFPSSSASQALFEGPWCAVQTGGPGTAIENCRMRTFEECRLEVIAGNRGHCRENPRWPGWYGGAGDEPLRGRRAR